MSREVRRVPEGWEHPREPGFYSDGKPRQRALHGYSFTECAADWDRGLALWLKGLRDDHEGGTVEIDKKYKRTRADFVQWDGDRPRPEDYMPEWPEAERTHYQMYETCSEGTPISPVMSTPKMLARWLADHNASSFGPMTATYEEWLAMIEAGSSVGSMVMTDGVMTSGVAAVSKFKDEE